MPRTRWRLALLSLVTLSGVLWIAWGSDAWERHEMERRRAELWAAGTYDEATFQRLEVRPDDFLAALPYRGETFAEFAEAHAAGSFSVERAEVVIVEPLTEVDAASLAAIEATLRALLGVPVAARSMPTPSHLLEGDGRDPHWNGVALAAQITEQFAEPSPTEPSVLRVGLVEHTLAVPGFDWIFGYTDEGRRSVVLSFRDLPDAPAALTFQIVSLVLHEVGHVLGLQHCVFYACVMTPAAHLDRTVDFGARYCPVCLRKLSHVLGRSARDLLSSFEDLFTSTGLDDEARRVRLQLEGLEVRGEPWR